MQLAAGPPSTRSSSSACNSSCFGEDVFFHQSALVGVTMDQLRQGDHVTYTAERDPRGKGLRATKVRLARE
jgi:cold shock CspA family protein